MVQQTTIVTGEYIFYFGPESVFSHWHKSLFVIDGIEYCCVEQFLMFNKAVLFMDFETAKKIRSSSSPQRHRYLGRQVTGFNKSAWQQCCLQYAAKANEAKFTQHAHLHKILEKTGNRRFAEASPYDRNWGIGLSLSNPNIYKRSSWRGKNLAGFALEQAREKIFFCSFPNQELVCDFIL